MAVTRAPQRQATTPAATSEVEEQAVLEVIQRGGSVQGDKGQAAKDKAQEEVLTDDLKNVQLRLYQSILNEIDALRVRAAKGRKPASRHAWILAAINEKLERER